MSNKKTCRVCYNEATHKYVKSVKNFMTRNNYSRDFIREVNVCDEHINTGFASNLKYQKYELKKLKKKGE